MRAPTSRVYAPSEADTANARLPQKNPPRRHIDTGASFALSKGFTPVILSSGEVTVSAGGGIAVPNHGNLQPVERSPMLIDEIHFNLRSSNSNTDSIDARGLTRVELALGRHYLTSGFVPIAGLEYSYLTNSMYGSQALGSTDYANKSFAGARWRLPTPQYVPAGSVLNCRLQFSALPYFTDTTTVTVADVSYVGRLLPVDYPVPRTIKIPYATSIFTSDTIPSGGTSVNPLLQSKDLQLGNPFDTTMYSQRFVMRQFDLLPGPAPVFPPIFVFAENYNSGSPIVTLRGTFNNVDISIAELLKHYTIFDDGFTASALGTAGHHVYNLYDMEMQPKDRFDLLIDSRAVTLGRGTVSVAALIGWRNEEI